MKETNEPYTRYPPRTPMTAVGWIVLGALIGLAIGYACIRMVG